MGQRQQHPTTPATPTTTTTPSTSTTATLASPVVYEDEYSIVVHPANARDLKWSVIDHGITQDELDRIVPSMQAARICGKYDWQKQQSVGALTKFVSRHALDIVLNIAVFHFNVKEKMDNETKAALETLKPKRSWLVYYQEKGHVIVAGKAITDDGRPKFFVADPIKIYSLNIDSSTHRLH